jgi:hypothetical protein
MKAVVVYESLFGNTARVGEAIAAALRARGVEVTAGPPASLEPSVVAAADLLVVGGPTHAHGMSSKGTRKTAVEDKKNAYDAPTVEPGLREWIPSLPSGAGRPTAAFDTRFDKPKVFTGSAAKGIAKRLEHQGYRVIAEPESFFVTTQNELEAGELEHAERWGTALAERGGTAAER